MLSLRPRSGQSFFQHLCFVGRQCLLPLLLVATYAGPVLALDEIARNCEYSNGSGGPWVAVNDLTSSTPRGSVLFTRSIAQFLRYEISSAKVPHELVMGGNWAGIGYPGPYETVATNVPGIGYRISLNSQDGRNRPVLPGNASRALDKRVTSSAGSVINNYRQELILTVDPGDLPSGELVVRSVAGSAILELWAVDMLKGTVGVGGQFDIPADDIPRGICRKRYAMVGPGAIEMGGGGPVPIPNRCEVQVGQSIPVRLGTVALEDFPKLGSLSQTRRFNITLSKCTAAARPEITFNDKYAAAQPVAPCILNLKPGGAQGIGIVMLNELDGHRILFDGSRYPMRRNADTAEMPLSAAYIRTAASSAELKAGEADGAAEFTFSFP
ncbi:MAG: hypothetical protein GAK36_00003 [Pseudomonas sp.]|nr:MAG: hypothetical protein GAK36_00003 [Pseudomonas sp.]